MNTKKKVLIIDPDRKVCREIKHALQSKTIEVHYVLSVHEGIKLIARYSFCLIIMDIFQSEVNGMELLKMIQQIKPIPILVLSSEKGDEKQIAALNAGAHGYLEKPYALEACLALAKSLMELYIQLHEEENPRRALAFGMDLIINPINRQAVLKGKLMRLTRKEFDLLLYFAGHAGQVLSREQIYRAVWNEDFVYNVDECVKAHIKSLRRKLQPSGREYIKNEWGVGYRFSPEDDKLL